MEKKDAELINKIIKDIQRDNYEMLISNYKKEMRITKLKINYESVKITTKSILLSLPLIGAAAFAGSMYESEAPFVELYDYKTYSITSDEEASESIVITDKEDNNINTITIETPKDMVGDLYESELTTFKFDSKGDYDINALIDAITNKDIDKIESLVKSFDENYKVSNIDSVLADRKKIDELIIKANLIVSELSSSGYYDYNHNSNVLNYAIIILALAGLFNMTFSSMVTLTDKNKINPIYCLNDDIKNRKKLVKKYKETEKKLNEYKELIKK